MEHKDFGIVFDREQIGKKFRVIRRHDNKTISIHKFYTDAVNAISNMIKKSNEVKHEQVRPRYETA